MKKFLLNCINAPDFASRRQISVDHLDSVRDYAGTTWQAYLVRLPNGVTYRCRVRCSANSQYNDLLVLY
jgi:hypothetical protein